MTQHRVCIHKIRCGPAPYPDGVYRATIGSPTSDVVMPVNVSCLCFIVGLGGGSGIPSLLIAPLSWIVALRSLRESRMSLRLRAGLQLYRDFVGFVVGVTLAAAPTRAPSGRADTGSPTHPPWLCY